MSYPFIKFASEITEQVQNNVAEIAGIDKAMDITIVDGMKTAIKDPLTHG
ncbi:MAG: hypothetical protein J6C44_00945 [Muribaculaceae bacterium]|nr:hypothetical protein [Muribaculaceae bacterium]